MALLDKLNDRQRQAAECTEGPVMIIAGAGSGKTRTLMYRIAHLLEVGNNPFQIMALTFTNKAAAEMKERIAELIGPSAHSLWMGTFHSIFCRILRAHAEKLGYEKTFSIYDTEDSRNLLKNIAKEKNLDPKQYNPKLVGSRISMAKSALVGPADYARNTALQEEDRMMQRPLIAELYTEYQNRLFHAGAMDFDDLLFQTNILLRDHPDVLAKYQEHFRYIMVDEYQDTNFAQYLIVKKLAAMHRNICVVGDDSQSIYSFRGANIQNILSFKADYPEARTIALEQNYRSTGVIVKLSNVLIENNKGRIPKTIWTQNDTGSLVKLLAAPTDEEEGRLVAQQIFETEMNERVHHKDFAILYRTNNQSKAMEDALRRLNIPYRIYGGKSFYQRKEIKDMVAYFRWVANPRDEACLLRCINLPARGIGDTTIDRLRILASARGCALFDAIELLRDPAVCAEANWGGAAATRLLRVRDMILSLNIRLSDTDAYTLAADIWKHCGIEQEYKAENTIESEARLRNVEELLNAVQEFVERDHFEVDEETGEMLPYEGVVTLDRFLQEIALLTDMDEDKDKDDGQKGDVVTLMTIHAAKGLEYPYVFVVGCEEDLFPSEMSSSTQEDLEEERRLFYVAVTRSERRLFLSFARKRMRWGQRNDTKPSRFLSEIACSDCFENPQVLKAPQPVFVDDDEERGAWGGFGAFGGRGGRGAHEGGRSDYGGRGNYGRGGSGHGNYGARGESGGYNGHVASSKRAVEPDILHIRPAEPRKLKKISIAPAGDSQSVSQSVPVSGGTSAAMSSAAAGTSGSASAAGGYAVGQRVAHAKFGLGTLVEIQGAGGDQRLIVKFDGLPQPKTLLAAFAKLQVVG